MAEFAPETHLREKFDASCAALLVVDLQNYCCHPAGGLFQAPGQSAKVCMVRVAGVWRAWLARHTRMPCVFPPLTLSPSRCSGWRYATSRVQSAHLSCFLPGGRVQP